MAMILILATPLTTARSAMATASVVDELIRETQRLADMVRDNDEGAGPIGAPVIVSTSCNHQRQWWYERCGSKEALVPFATTGPGSATWHYVALFRILPRETDMGAERQREHRRRLKHVTLVTFAFVPQPLGLIDWRTARAEEGHIMVQTRHWTDHDGHANPTGPGMIRIDLEGGLKLTNIP